MTAALIPSAMIDQIEAARTACLAKFAQARQLVSQAHELAAVAAPIGRHDLPDLARRDTRAARGLDAFNEEVRRALDRDIWMHLLRVTQLETLMDQTAKAEFHRQVENDPPPATAANCRATVERLIAESGDIFKRGIATAFSKLDRRFRSHDGFKLGSRVVLTYFQDTFGIVSRTRENTLMDIERTFAVLEGKPQPERSGGIVGALGLAQPRGLRVQAYEATSPYLRVRVFKNGNAHVWFTRDDLLARVNLLLAEYYGAALGAGADAVRGAARAEHSAQPNRTPARNFGFFPTPAAVAARAFEAADVGTPETRSGTYPRLSILDPSAGRGDLAKPLTAAGHKVTCVEIQAALSNELGGQGHARTVHGDFFDMTLTDLGQFDRIVMNPPFDGRRDIDHVNHAVQFLAPGGVLVAIMSASVEFRETPKAIVFRQMIERMGGRIIDLPDGSFRESGTMVNTVLVTLRARAPNSS
jgi:predicted RNA methylase